MKISVEGIISDTLIIINIYIKMSVQGKIYGHLFKSK